MGVKSKFDSSDEKYVLELCDDVLGRNSARQHRFDFLRGDPNAHGKSWELPVDAYYEEIKLVVEYREKQHTESVPFFDKRKTISGVSRGEQRAKYDQKRRDVLPRHGINLVEFSYIDFQHDTRKRLIRDRLKDKDVIRRKLQQWIR